MKKVTNLIEFKDAKGNTHIETKVYYDKGGYSYFSGKFRPRGYYASATPVRVEGNFQSTIMFSGYGEILLETSRYSEKQFSHALDMSKSVLDKLVERLKSENTAA